MFPSLHFLFIHPSLPSCCFFFFTPLLSFLYTLLSPFSHFVMNCLDIYYVSSSPFFLYLLPFPLSSSLFSLKPYIRLTEWDQSMNLQKAMFDNRNSSHITAKTPAFVEMLYYRCSQPLHKEKFILSLFFLISLAFSCSIIFFSRSLSFSISPFLFYFIQFISIISCILFYRAVKGLVEAQVREMIKDR